MTLNSIEKRFANPDAVIDTSSHDSTVQSVIIVYNQIMDLNTIYDRYTNWMINFYCTKYDMEFTRAKRTEISDL